MTGVQTCALRSGRKLQNDAWPKGEIRASFGTDWSSLCGAWFTEWERTGDPRWRARIVDGMRTIAALQKQWFAGSATYDVKTGKFSGASDRLAVSHLNAAFGAPEIHVEMLALIREPAYDKAWLDYCRWYNAPKEGFVAKWGEPFGPRNLKQGHSRLTAFAAHAEKDAALATRAAEEFYGGDAGFGMMGGDPRVKLPGGGIEWPGVSTNASAQWGLAAIQLLALVPEALDSVAVPPRRRRGG